MNNDQFPTLQLIGALAISFFAAFAKGLNEFAKNPHETIMFFISEVLLSGISGLLIGVITLYFTDNLLLVIFFSGVGGLLGIRMIKITLKVLLMFKNIDIEKLNIDDDLNDINKTDKKEDRKK